MLDDEINAYKENGDEDKLPQELIDFLRQKLHESEYGDLILVVQ